MIKFRMRHRENRADFVSSYQTSGEPSSITFETGNMKSIEWKLKTLGELTVNLDSVRVPVKGADRKKGPYPYYGASGIVDYVDEYLFEGEHLLIAEDGENLRTRQTPIAFLANGKFWVNNHAHIVKGNAEAETKFLCYALANTDISGYLSGSTMPKLTQGNMNRIPIPTPPLSIQKRIVEILGSLDDKIELNRRMNETLEAMARRLFKSWFVDFDPVHAKARVRREHPNMSNAELSRLALPSITSEIAALFPDSFEDSTIGPIPKGWRLDEIGKVVSVFGGGTPSTKNIEFWDEGVHSFCTPKDMSSLSSPILLQTERRLTDAGLARVSSGQLPVGTVLLSSRAPIGYLAVAEIPVSVNQGIIAMFCDGVVSNQYVLHWARENMDAIIANANGSTFLEISKKNFRPISILIPENWIINAFSRQADELHAQCVSNLRESNDLAMIRDRLLPRLLSGDLSVSGARHDASG